MTIHGKTGLLGYFDQNEIFWCIFGVNQPLVSCSEIVVPMVTTITEQWGVHYFLYTSCLKGNGKISSVPKAAK